MPDDPSTRADPVPTGGGIHDTGRPVIRCVSSPTLPTDALAIVDDVAAFYGVSRPVLADRPWTALNMVTSIDGSVVLDGASGGLGNATDRSVLGALRAAADIIVVGAGTAQHEGYRPPHKPGQRIAVVTNSGRVDDGSELFISGAGVAITTAHAETPPGIDVLRAGLHVVDLAEALHMITDLIRPGGWAIVEGGPSLNGSLLALDLIDEINVTTAPMMVGGRGGRLASGGPQRLERFDLVHQLIDSEQYVFSRWVRRDRADRRLS